MKYGENSLANKLQVANAKTDAAKDDAGDDVELIRELAETATPGQIKAWIAHLEKQYEVKKGNIRTKLKKKVDDLLRSNGYTIEELFAARQLPSTSELAQRAKKRDKAASLKKEKLKDAACGL